jgi:D-xylose transport system permease protein
LISVGIVYVLLLGEIDLSVGAISGLAAACMAVLNVKHDWSPYLAIAVALLVGCGIGLLQGSLFTRFGIPSFVVTLAGLLAWQGALLQVLGSTGSINITDPKITGLANTFYSDTVGWVLLVIGLAAYGAVLVIGERRRVAAGLEGQSSAANAVRFVGVAAVSLAALLVFNSDRGVPLALLILLGFVVGMEYVVKQTGFGRHVFAVGGNAEAARRAGIPVTRVRIAVFAISGTMAAIGGVMAASRLLAVNQNSGGNELLLLAIAGPVIAGTSLFGGRGSVWTALLGALVIGSISNGMDLLALSSAVKFMVTGGVLLLAVIVDAVARQQRQASGRA